MNESWVALIVASIPVIGAGVGWLIKYVLDFRKENRRDHGIVMEAINDLKVDVREVKGNLNDHVEWHLMKNKRVKH
jgi:hypothetical protein